MSDALQERFAFGLVRGRGRGEVKDDDDAAEGVEDFLGLGREEGGGPFGRVRDEVQPDGDGGGVVGRSEGEGVGGAGEGGLRGGGGSGEVWGGAVRFCLGVFGGKGCRGRFAFSRGGVAYL